MIPGNKERGSLPPSRQLGAQGHRQIARSAHLHSIEADKTRERIKRDVNGMEGVGQTVVSPRSAEVVKVEDPLAWDDDTESVVGSTGEVEEDLDAINVQPKEIGALEKELEAIWKKQ